MVPQKALGQDMEKDLEMVEKMKIINTVFLAESVTTRSNLLVMITHPKNEADRKKQAPFSKLGRIGGQTLRGWVRHAMEKLLLQHGVSVCHPLSEISITADRNKDYFQNDIALGYHPRGACRAEGGCPIYRMFGDLDYPGNLMVSSVYFYPTTSGNGTVTKNINKLFGGVGSGRLEVINNSPRCRSKSHQVYLTVENLVGVMIEAPLKLIFREPDRDQEVLLLKTLEFLKIKAQQNEFEFLLGGMRTSGYGKGAILPIKPKKTRKTRNKSLLSEEDTEVVSPKDEIPKTYTIQFKLKAVEAAKLETAFQNAVRRWREKFPISWEDSPKDEEKENKNGRVKEVKAKKEMEIEK